MGHVESLFPGRAALPTATAVAVLAAASLAGSSAAEHSAAEHSAAEHSAAKHSAANTCRPAVIKGVLPVWARTGFSDPKPRMPYVLGRGGKILGILWTDTLNSPPAKDHNNKILWVSHATPRPQSDLRISAQRMNGSTAVGHPVARSVYGSPGPSIIDLPAAGCWRFTLRWSGRVDTLDLRYVR
jgi:hypothetical protein